MTRAHGRAQFTSLGGKGKPAAGNWQSPRERDREAAFACTFPERNDGSRHNNAGLVQKKKFGKFFRFLVASNLLHMHETLNIDKK
jgi:hypothetical protein